MPLNLRASLDGRRIVELARCQIVKVGVDARDNVDRLGCQVGQKRGTIDRAGQRCIALIDLDALLVAAFRAIASESRS